MSVHESVRELLTRYFDAVDRADLVAVQNLLDGASVVLGGRVLSGRDELAAAYGPRLLEPVGDRRRTAHHLTNVLVTVEGVSSLRVAASYIRLDLGPVVASGRIEQLVETTAEGLRVLEHRVQADL